MIKSKTFKISGKQSKNITRKIKKLNQEHLSVYIDKEVENIRKAYDAGFKDGLRGNIQLKEAKRDNWIIWICVLVIFISGILLGSS